MTRRYESAPQTGPPAKGETPSAYFLQTLSGRGEPGLPLPRLVLIEMAAKAAISWGKEQIVFHYLLA